jgi:hypothetical protein
MQYIEKAWGIPPTFFLPLVFLIEHVSFVNAFFWKEVIAKDSKFVQHQLEEEAFYQGNDVENPNDPKRAV